MKAILAGAAAVAAWFLLAKENRKLEKGKAYEIILEGPEALRTMPLDKLQKQLPALLPPGADIVVDTQSTRVHARFVAPAAGTVSDISTPIGTFKIVRLTELS